MLLLTHQHPVRSPSWLVAESFLLLQLSSSTSNIAKSAFVANTLECWYRKDPFGNSSTFPLCSIALSRCPRWRYVIARSSGCEQYPVDAALSTRYTSTVKRYKG